MASIQLTIFEFPQSKHLKSRLKCFIRLDGISFKTEDANRWMTVKNVSVYHSLSLGELIRKRKSFETVSVQYPFELKMDPTVLEDRKTD